MCTFLGASNQLTAADVDPALIEGAAIVYLEGYLFDPPEARRAFAKAAGLARASGRTLAITLSDSFVVERHRAGAAGVHRDRGRPGLRQRGGDHRAVRDRRLRRRDARRSGSIAKMAAVTRSEKGSVVVTAGRRHRGRGLPGRQGGRHHRRRRPVRRRLHAGPGPRPPARGLRPARRPRRRRGHLPLWPPAAGLARRARRRSRPRLKFPPGSPRHDPPHQLPLHQRKRLRGPSGQGRRPHLRRGGRRLPGRRPVRARRLRDDGHHQPHHPGRRGARARAASSTSLEDKVRAAVKDIGYEQDGFHWRDRRLRLPPARPVGRHRHGRRRGRQQGRGRRRPGHHVRLRHRRDAGADAGDAAVFAQHPEDAWPRRATPASGRSWSPTPRAR